MAKIKYNISYTTKVLSRFMSIKEMDELHKTYCEHRQRARANYIDYNTYEPTIEEKTITKDVLKEGYSYCEKKYQLSYAKIQNIARKVALANMAQGKNK